MNTDSAITVTQSVKPLRADAQRNRQTLLATAREVFSAGELEIRMEDIARKAGVGVGTLYRHFETREALIEAVYQQEIDMLCASAADLLGTMSADEAFSTFLNRLIAHAADNRGLATALIAGMVQNSPAFTRGSGQVMEAVTLLLNAAVNEKRFRADIEPTTVLIVVGALCSAQNDPSWQQRAQAVVALLLDGLRFGLQLHD